MLAQATGGKSFSAGVFYDDSFDHTLYAPKPGCASARATETAYVENLDRSLVNVTGGGTVGQPLTQQLDSWTRP